MFLSSLVDVLMFLIYSCISLQEGNENESAETIRSRSKKRKRSRKQKNLTDSTG